MAVFWYKGRRYVADVDQPVMGETGAAVPELAGWTISVVGGDFAVLSNDTERATVVMRAARP